MNYKNDIAFMNSKIFKNLVKIGWYRWSEKNQDILYNHWVKQNQKYFKFRYLVKS